MNAEPGTFVVCWTGIMECGPPGIAMYNNSTFRTDKRGLKVVGWFISGINVASHEAIGSVLGARALFVIDAASNRMGWISSCWVQER